jgi:superoxide reductase
MFDPMQEPVVRSEFSLGAYSGAIYVLSVCNQHDSWLNMAEI